MDKYFTPSIEDIRVGYECELWSRIPPKPNDWNKNIITPFIMKLALIKANELDKWVRVPYLTKEQIEAEGWTKVDNKINDTQRIGYIPDYELITDFGRLRLYLRYLDKPYEEITIERYTKSNPNEPWSMSGKWIVYNGKCKDINTFRYICKLLGI